MYEQDEKQDEKPQPLTRDQKLAKIREVSERAIPDKVKGNRYRAHVENVEILDAPTVDEHDQAVEALERIIDTIDEATGMAVLNDTLDEATGMAVLNDTLGELYDIAAVALGRPTIDEQRADDAGGEIAGFTQDEGSA